MTQTAGSRPLQVPWRRHYLDRRSSPSVEEAVGALVGIQTTYETTPPLSLAARLPVFEPDELSDALARGRLVWMSAMRGSKFVLPSGMAGAAVAAFASLAEELTWAGLRSMGMELSEVERSLEEVRRVLEEAGAPLSAAAVKRASRRVHADGALYVLAARGEVMRAGKRGSYTLRRLWLPHLDAIPTHEDAVRLFVSAYLKAYGPASEDDAAWWTGLPRAAVRAALASAGSADGDGYWTAADATRDIRPPRDSLRLLPALDPLTTGWLKRERLAAPEAYKLIYTKQGTSRPAVMLGGRLVGTWDVKGKVELAEGIEVARAQLDDELKRMRRAPRDEGRDARR